MDENEAKKRTLGAIERFLKRQEPREMRHNEAPEREVVKQILNFGKVKKWDLDVVEAKAVWNTEAQRFVSGQVKAGYSDISGNTELGHALYIEAKAPGKRSTLRDDQLEFLLRKIASNCFAVVVDSVSGLETYYNGWLLAEDKKSYLRRALPRTTMREQKNQDLSFD